MYSRLLMENIHIGAITVIAFNSLFVAYFIYQLTIQFKAFWLILIIIQIVLIATILYYTIENLKNRANINSTNNSIQQNNDKNSSNDANNINSVNNNKQNKKYKINIIILTIVSLFTNVFAMILYKIIQKIKPIQINTNQTSPNRSNQTTNQANISNEPSNVYPKPQMPLNSLFQPWPHTVVDLEDKTVTNLIFTNKYKPKNDPSADIVTEIMSYRDVCLEYVQLDDSSKLKLEKPDLTFFEFCKNVFQHKSDKSVEFIARNEEFVNILSYLTLLPQKNISPEKNLITFVVDIAVAFIKIKKPSIYFYQYTHHEDVFNFFKSNINDEIWNEDDLKYLRNFIEQNRDKTHEMDRYYIQDLMLILTQRLTIYNDSIEVLIKKLTTFNKISAMEQYKNKFESQKMFYNNNKEVQKQMLEPLEEALIINAFLETGINKNTLDITEEDLNDFLKELPGSYAEVNIAEYNEFKTFGQKMYEIAKVQANNGGSCSVFHFA